MIIQSVTYKLFMDEAFLYWKISFREKCEPFKINVKKKILPGL